MKSKKITVIPGDSVVTIIDCDENDTILIIDNRIINCKIKGLIIDGKKICKKIEIISKYDITFKLNTHEL